MKIKSAEIFILHVPVTRGKIADSMHEISHWGIPGVILHTDEGLSGYGYTGTHAHLATDRLIVDCIANVFLPSLLGTDAQDIDAVWDNLYHFPPVQWVGRAGIVTLALSAIDVALWDLKAKAARLPLWKLLGGEEGKRIEAYNTDGGWLNWSDDELVEDSLRLAGDGDFRGIKIKVGSTDIERDVRRVGKVRKAIGENVKLMVDANGRWDVRSASAFAARVKDYDVGWLEEPLWYDDLEAHAILARQIEIPIALGEQLYCLNHFHSFFSAGAVHYAQPDAVRLAGVTEWRRVADLAVSFGLPVVAHVGDMMQIHLQLSLAHKACGQLEYIPWLRECFEEPATVRNGWFERPQQPGAGTTLMAHAFEQFDVVNTH